jgi:hypothetical protein
MRNPNPKTGLRLRWAKLVCRLRGHDVGKILKYSPLWVLVGTGCRRCEIGEVTRYRSKGPLPLAVREELAQLPAGPVFP